ncbi:hypothetical protein KFE25_009544 [Diacronema lutheri]|uniref:EF-hand domain-containing protein n=2 Tax=Diacronema lutheri TaxID=2081491 RepID=A0A8J5XMR9_DIALT|nr:hypothetical protein KFE25_009544 [Diacronema lutheri]
MPTFLDTNGHAHTLRDQDDVVLYDGERIPIMSNLSQIIKDWTKAVMVACPEDTLEFSRDYFAKLAMQGRQSRALVGETQGGSKLALSAGKVYRSLPVDMQERIEHIFMAFDAGESGSINKADVFDSLKQIGSFFDVQATQQDANELLRMTDAAAHQLSWPEFSTAVVSWVSDRGLI